MGILVLIAAIEFACKAHKGQVRKSTGGPYISHPVAVMSLVQTYEPDLQLAQAAAVLHDVMEDCDISFQELKSKFGTVVAQTVRACSEDGAIGPGPKASWETRKQASIDALSHKSYAALLVTCADKLHNVMGLVQEHETQGDKLWERFSRGKEKQLWVYGTTAEKIQEIAWERFPDTGLALMADDLVDEVASLR